MSKRHSGDNGPPRLRSAARARASEALRWGVALWSLAATGCIAENDDACGPNQVYATDTTILEYAVCVCDEANGYVFDQQRGYGCTECAEGEVISEGACASETDGDNTDGDNTDGDDTDAGTGAGEPTGIGEPCESDADCQGFDAQYCDVLQTHTCMVDDCASGNNSCGSSSVCCDYSALLAGFSICVAEGDLAGGDCPMGGMKVEP